MGNDVQIKIDIDYGKVIEEQALQIAGLLKDKSILKGQVQALGERVIVAEAKVESYEKDHEASGVPQEA